MRNGVCSARRQTGRELTECLRGYSASCTRIAALNGSQKFDGVYVLRWCLLTQLGVRQVLHTKF